MTIALPLHSTSKMIYKAQVNFLLRHFMLIHFFLELCFCIGFICGLSKQWFMQWKQHLQWPWTLTLNLGLEVDMFSNRHVCNSPTWKLQSEHEGVVVHLGLWHQHTIVIVDSCKKKNVFVFYVSSWGPEKQVNIYRQEELNVEKKVSRPILAYNQTQTAVLFSEIKTQCIHPHFNRCWVFFAARLFSKMTKALPYSSGKPDKCDEGRAPTSVFFKQEGVVGFQGLT